MQKTQFMIKVCPSFMIKPLKNQGTEGNYVSIIMGLCDYPIDNAKWGRLETFNFKSEIRHVRPFPFYRVLGVQTRKISKRKKQGILSGKSSFFFIFLHTDAKVIYLRDPKDCPRKILKFINPIIKFIRYKTEHTEIIMFFYNSKIARKKFEKTPPHNSL